MGKRLKKYASRPDLMVSSPAKRALKTAGIMAKALGFPVKKIVTDASIYAAGVSDLLDVIRNIDDAFHHVMMCGHNPGMTMLAEYLTHRRVENIPTCGIFCIDFDIDSWREVPEGGGSVVFSIIPRSMCKRFGSEIAAVPKGETNGRKPLRPGHELGPHQLLPGI